MVWGVEAGASGERGVDCVGERRMAFGGEGSVRWWRKIRARLGLPRWWGSCLR
ncbi:hypothetical protein [Bartonella schoenbuchensis]|uniref:hypothetical protein n=1 Tax=Bartonella schoenbuchensis TaxID=165694 RepID=UPI001ABA21FC|nr:hypothetical protein [Bartonella schoenbuchensis]